MVTVGIKELKDNPSIITKWATSKEDNYLIISKRGKPIAVAIPIEDSIFDYGFRKWLLIKAYQNGDISLGQLSKTLNLSYQETMQLLGTLGVEVIDYSLDDDIKTIDKHF